MRKTQYGTGNGKNKLLWTGELFWNQGVLGIPHSNRLNYKILQTETTKYSAFLMIFKAEQIHGNY